MAKNQRLNKNRTRPYAGKSELYRKVVFNPVDNDSDRSMCLCHCTICSGDDAILQLSASESRRKWRQRCDIRHQCTTRIVFYVPTKYALRSLQIELFRWNTNTPAHSLNREARTCATVSTQTRICQNWLCATQTCHNCAVLSGQNRCSLRMNAYIATVCITLQTRNAVIEVVVRWFT